MTRTLAVDVGGSALKAALFAGDGRRLAFAERSLRFDETPDGGSEIDPARWRAALASAFEALARDAGGPDGVGAVCVCGMTRTQVLIDEAGRVLRPAMGFMDRRAAEEAASARRRLGPDAPAEAARLDAGHPLARLMRIREREPDVWSRLAWVLEPKDWLILELTGEVGSDPVSQARLTAAWEGGAASLAARLGLDRDPRPPLSAPTSEAGRARSGLDGALAALAGARVFRGSHDAWAAAAGLGALESGAAYVISGTSETAGLLSPRPAAAPGLMTVQWDEALWQIGGPGLNGASTLDWARRALAEAEPGPPPARPLLFLPFLRGERTPYWDADLRAAFLGLEDSHGPRDLARAVMEGLGFLNRDVIERAEAASGLRAARILLAGGGAQGAWPAIRAEATGREIAVPDLPHAGLAGCAAVALTGLGRFASVAEAARAIAGPPRVERPDPGMRARMDATFEAWLAATSAAAEAGRRLAAAAALSAAPAPAPAGAS